MRIAVVATVLVLAGLMVADWYVRNIDLQRLVTATDAVTEAVQQWETDRRRIMASLPSEHYMTPELRERSQRQLEREAEAAATALTEAAAGVEDITVRLAWHQGIIRARDSVLDYVDAWVTRLQRVARDADALAEPAPAISTARTASARAFREALPPAALYGLGDSIEAMFADRPR